MTAAGSPDGSSYEVQETLRQICIARPATHGFSPYEDISTSHQTKASIAAASKWWTYAGHFQEKCLSGATKNFTACKPEQIRKIVQDVGIDEAKVQACMDMSGGTAIFGGRNRYLDEEVVGRYTKGALETPTLMINGLRYRGSLECNYKRVHFLRVKRAQMETGKQDYPTGDRSGPKHTLRVTPRFEQGLHKAILSLHNGCPLLRAVCAGFRRHNEPLLCSHAIVSPKGRATSLRHSLRLGVHVHHPHHATHDTVSPELSAKGSLPSIVKMEEDEHTNIHFPDAILDAPEILGQHVHATRQPYLLAGTLLFTSIGLCFLHQRNGLLFKAGYGRKNTKKGFGQTKVRVPDTSEEVYPYPTRAGLQKWHWGPTPTTVSKTVSNY